MITLPHSTTARAVTVTLGLAIATAAATVSAASATTLRGGGNPIAPGSTVGAPIFGAPMLTATGSAACASGVFAAAVGTNPAASVTLTPTIFSLSNCTDTFPGFDLSSVSLGSPGAGSVAYTSASPPQGAVRLVGTTLRAQTTTSAVCTYTINNPTTTASAAITNATNQITFAGVPLATVSAPCSTANPATLTAQFGPLTVFSVPPGSPPGSATAGSPVTVGP